MERRPSFSKEKRQRPWWKHQQLSTRVVFVGIVSVFLLTILTQLLLAQTLTPSQQQSTRRLLATNEEVTCVAWRATEECTPNGPRKSHSAVSYFADTDLSCSQYVPTYGSGYCELVTNEGKTIHAFQKSCTRGKIGPFPWWKHFAPVFSCQQSVEFLNYKERAHSFQPPIPIANDNSRGIVMQIYPSAMPSVYTIVKLLRTVHQCVLPIELWLVEGEMTEDHSMLQHLRQNFDNIHVRTILAKDLGGAKNSYMSKPYTLAYSQFDEVLFLDSDNFPLRDPTYLFEEAAYTTKSALFWKDFWNPQRNDYMLTQDSLVWELLGIDSPAAKAEMEMESGQMVIDRRKSVKALQILLFLSQSFGEWMEPLVLIWGDKDLIRLAWHMTQTPFHYIEQPPSLAGKDVVFKFASYDKVCGITMVQHDPEGKVIFFHRNIAKLSSEADLIRVWEKGVKFVGSDPNTQYEIEGSRSFYRMHGCYHPTPSTRDYFQEIDYRRSNIEHFEDKLLQFAREGLGILREKR